MTKRIFKILNVTFHQWNVLNNVNNVVLLKCTCCKQQRVGVAEQRETQRSLNGTKVTHSELTFWYHGYDVNYAQQLFNKLIQQRDEDDDGDENTTVNNVNKHNGDRTLAINNVKITITNPRGEKR